MATTTRSMAARQERIKASPRWDGERFRNTQVLSRVDAAVPMPKLSEFLCGGERRVPLAPLPAINPLDAWSHPAQSGLRATWLGHSTVLCKRRTMDLVTGREGPFDLPIRLGKSCLL